MKIKKFMRELVAWAPLPLMLVILAWLPSGPAILGFVDARAASEGSVGGVMRVNHLAERVSGPQLVTVSNAALTLFIGTNDSRTSGRVLLRTVQNTGTAAVLYTINTTNVSTTNYHGVLAGGTAARDGTGSILDLSRVPWPVTVRTEGSATVLAVVELTQ